MFRKDHLSELGEEGSYPASLFLSVKGEENGGEVNDGLVLLSIVVGANVIG